MSMPPAIIVKGGQDLDGSWGTGKTFVREFYFELINVPLPMFMISPFIPAYNSFHPIYPFALAKDSKISKNIETPRGRAITVSTTYQILKPNVSLNGLSGWDVDAVIQGNLPHLLPAQDVSYEPVAVEETLHSLFQADAHGWYEVPFRTTAGTKLMGTTTRNILKMSFWYFVDPLLFDDAALVTQFTGTVNAFPIVIAGRLCPPGVAKIESIEVNDHTWERPNVAPYSVKMVKVVLLIDCQTWNKRYENVSNLFMAYPYLWEETEENEKPDTKFQVDPFTNQPLYDIGVNNISPQRIFCTMYDPEPKNEGSTSEPIWVQDPKKAVQFFGTREDCFRLNPDSEPTEAAEPMYLDKNGFVLYPDPNTGKVDHTLSPKVEGFDSPPMNFTALHFPIR